MGHFKLKTGKREGATIDRRLIRFIARQLYGVPGNINPPKLASYKPKKRAVKKPKKKISKSAKKR